MPKKNCRRSMFDYVLSFMLFISPVSVFAIDSGWEDVGFVGGKVVQAETSDFYPPTEDNRLARLKWRVISPDGHITTSDSVFNCEAEVVLTSAITTIDKNNDVVNLDFVDMTVSVNGGTKRTLRKDQAKAKVNYPVVSSPVGEVMSYVCQKRGNLTSTLAAQSDEVIKAICSDDEKSVLCVHTDSLVGKSVRHFLMRVQQIAPVCSLDKKKQSSFLLNGLDGIAAKCAGSSEEPMCALKLLVGFSSVLGDELAKFARKEETCHRTTALVGAASDSDEIAEHMDGFRACVRSAANVLTDKVTPANVIAEAVINGCNDKLPPSFFKKPEWVKVQLNEIIGLVLAKRAGRQIEVSTPKESPAKNNL